MVSYVLRRAPVAFADDTGPVFRDGPNSLSYCDAQALKKIYGIGKNAFPRTATFPPIGLNPENPPVFFSITPDVHQRSRRRVAGAVS
jgi:hypothetical protein